MDGAAAAGAGGASSGAGSGVGGIHAPSAAASALFPGASLSAQAGGDTSLWQRSLPASFVAASREGARQLVMLAVFFSQALLNVQRSQDGYRAAEVGLEVAVHIDFKFGEACVRKTLGVALARQREHAKARRMLCECVLALQCSLWRCGGPERPSPERFMCVRSNGSWSVPFAADRGG